MSEYISTLWRARDYETLLVEPFPYAIGAMVDEQPFADFAVDFIKECPKELQAKYPIPMLRLVFFLLSGGKEKEADILMQQIKSEIESIKDTQNRNNLLGEFMFIKAFFYYPNISKMLSAIEESDELSGGHVEVMDVDQPFLNQMTNPYCVFHTTPGKAEEEGEQYKRYISIYSKLTGGGGVGSDILYDAGLCYYRGDFTAAKLLYYKSEYLAETKRQVFTQLGAVHMLALIAMHEMDNDTFSKAVETLDEIANSRPEIAEKIQYVLEIERTDLFQEISIKDHTPEWIQKGKVPVAISVLGVPYIKFQQMRYFFCSDKFEQCIGLGEALLNGGHQYGLLVKAIIGMYVAFSYMTLGHIDKGISLFKESFPPLFKDKLYLVFTYFYEHMDGILDDYLKENYPDDVGAIDKQMKQNLKGRIKFMHTFLDETNSLTQKELEVATLAAEGLQNKEISERLGISVNTVRTHLRQVFEKLEIDRRSEISKLLK